MFYDFSLLVLGVASVIIFGVYCFAHKKYGLEIDFESILISLMLCLGVFAITNLSLNRLDLNSMDNDNIVKYRTIYTKSLVNMNEDNDSKEKKYFKKLDDSIQVIVSDGVSKEFKKIPLSCVKIFEDDKPEVKFVKEYRTGWISKIIGEESDYAESHYELHIPKGTMNFYN